MLLLRSLLFNLLFFAATAAGCVLLVWTLPFHRQVLMAGVVRYLRLVALLERRILHLDYRVVGREHLPAGPYIVAAKHQSTWETLKLHLLLPDPAVVLKQELMYLPLWGWFAAKAQMIPVRRGAGSGAIRRLTEAARRRIAEGRQVVIFPQGTRVPPGARRPYRGGIGALYESCGVPVVPMALNSGLFWGRRAFLKRPGTITVAFLPAIPPGLPRPVMMERLESGLETAADALLAEAGGPARPAICPA